MRVSSSRALITNQGMRPITLLATAVVLMVGHLQLRAEPVAQNRPLPPAIAVSKSATLVERNAATELAEYLRRITGRDFPVATTDSVTGKALFAVGPALQRRPRRTSTFRRQASATTASCSRPSAKP